MTQAGPQRNVTMMLSWGGTEPKWARLDGLDFYHGQAGVIRPLMRGRDGIALPSLTGSAPCL
jgi:hypothetical protein